MLDLFFQKVYAADLPYPGEVPPGGTPPSGSTGGSTADSLLASIKSEILQPIIYLLVGLAVIYFLWGMFEFIQNADNSSKREDGYKHMIYGVIGLVIIFSVNGIIALITSTLGIAQ